MKGALRFEEVFVLVFLRLFLLERAIELFSEYLIALVRLNAIMVFVEHSLRQQKMSQMWRSNSFNNRLFCFFCAELLAKFSFLCLHPAMLTILLVLEILFYFWFKTRIGKPHYLLQLEKNYF